MDRLKELSEFIEQFNVDRDWDQFHSLANLSKAISIEANELLECFLWDNDNYKLDKVKEELADVFIYCIQMQNKLDIDLIEIAQEKMNKNAEKYPVEKAKGNSKKYTEF